MRALTFALPALLLLAAAACAPSVGNDRYASELQRLTEQCSARGGILSPTSGQSGRPQLDNVCKVTGLPSPLTAGG
ncbi:hypothetical protein [Brevundimonas sp.]|uniref:hypothetical protein n=1 Tax=Brevundimonas sp. TaxID=1871086 RepID=UPI0035637374